MPLYDYSCPACGNQFEQYAPMSGSHDQAECSCGQSAVRVWRPVQVSVSKIWDGYNPGLGCRTRNYRDVKDAMARYKDNTGVELVEVGSQKLDTKPKPKRQEYLSGGQLGF